MLSYAKSRFHANCKFDKLRATRRGNFLVTFFCKLFSLSFHKTEHYISIFIHSNHQFKMNKLPTEIVVDISSCLSFKETLNLACCNKTLHRIILEPTYIRSWSLNRVKFDQAMTLKRTSDFTQQIHRLSIENVVYDSQFIMALPTVFPRVKRLVWKNDKTILRRNSTATVHLDTNHFNDVIKNWNNMESITDFS